MAILRSRIIEVASVSSFYSNTVRAGTPALDREDDGSFILDKNKSFVRIKRLDKSADDLFLLHGIGKEQLFQIRRDAASFHLRSLEPLFAECRQEEPSGVIRREELNDVGKDKLACMFPHERIDRFFRGERFVEIPAKQDPQVFRERIILGSRRMNAPQLLSPVEKFLPAYAARNEGGFDHGEREAFCIKKGVVKIEKDGHRERSARASLWGSCRTKLILRTSPDAFFTSSGRRKSRRMTRIPAEGGKSSTMGNSCSVRYFFMMEGGSGLLLSKMTSGARPIYFAVSVIKSDALKPCVCPYLDIRLTIRTSFACALLKAFATPPAMTFGKMLV